MIAESPAYYSPLADSGAHKRRPSWRLPGCGDECREVRAVMLDWLRPTTYVLHDPATHEAHGRKFSEMIDPDIRRERVVTGELVIDHETLVVTVHGSEVACTPKELQILLFLSSRLGRTCTVNEILIGCWGTSYACATTVYTHGRVGEAHLLRVNMARLRAKLGTARRLIVTRPGIGYCMVREPAP